MISYYFCKTCNNIVAESGMLRALNPFDPEDELLGCPVCKDVNSFDPVCDEPSCTRPVDCGTPTLDGYRQTCHWHQPERK